MVGIFRRGLLAVVCVVTLAGCGSGPMVGRPVSEDRVTVPDTPLPTPRTIVRDGVTYRVAKVATQAVTIDRARPRDLGVAVFQMDSDSTPECAQLATSVHVAEETETAVFIAAFGYTKPSHGTRGCTYATSSNESPYTNSRLHLRKAVGNRAIIDVKTGKNIAVAASQPPPVPSYVPSGYGSSLAQPFDAAHGFVAVRQFHKKQSTIEIRLRSATAWQRSGTVTGHTEINGHAAVVTVESWQRCVSWSDDSRMIREVCALTFHDDPALTAAELERISRSLPD